MAVKKEKVDSFSYNLKVTGTEFCNELNIEDKWGIWEIIWGVSFKSSGSFLVYSSFLL